MPSEQGIDVTFDTNDPHTPSVALRLGRAQEEGAWSAWASSTRFKTTTSEEFKLADHRGKVVVLAYFASFCPPCFKEFPELEAALWQPLKGEDVLVFGVAGPTDDSGLRQRFREQTGVTFPFLISGPPPSRLLPRDSMVTYYPFHVVIDKAGEVSYVGSRLHLGELRAAVMRAKQPVANQP